MSEGVNEKSVSFVVSSNPSTSTTTTTTESVIDDSKTTTLEISDVSKKSSEQSTSPPTVSNNSTIKPTIKKHRRHGTTGRIFHLIDGKKIRSALTHKKWPPRGRRVSFPTNDDQLITGYLEPANPWEQAENVNIEGLISSYKASCQRHGAEPLENLVAQLEKLDISDDERCPELSLKNECLDHFHCEPLEELLKRVQFVKIDVESSSLDDESATILFDMLEYYQSATHLNMSGNRNIGSRGWQACAQMIKKTMCLEQLEARDITLTQQHMNILKRPLQLVSHLHVLKLENCGLAGRAFVILVSALKMNTGLKELYLADNCLEQQDAIQLGALLRINNHLQLLDISNNHIKDEGVRDLLEGLVAQTGERRNAKGLSILVLWNNDLTRSSSTYFTEAIAQSVTLETLNIGQNHVGNELLELAQETLIKSRTLLQLGMQSTNITCKGALLLAGIIERNRSLQRIDLRDNNIQMEGLAALSFAIKRNSCVTQLDLDPTPWSTKPATMNQYVDLVNEIKACCSRNEEIPSTDDSTEESMSPQHRSRLSSCSSRKISLTCQTLPRSPPSLAPNSINNADITQSNMLEPKRTTGGRLRSPAPSPVPSPVASPVPSPSRGRFVVSKVCENSMSSTNSSASSSPCTPTSLGSSPVSSFFPNVVASSSPSSSFSRFRVTVVEPIPTTTTTQEIPAITETPEIQTKERKFVVTTASAENITIGFNYNIQRAECSFDSDDSDSVFRSELEEAEHQRLIAVEKMENLLKPIIEDKTKMLENENIISNQTSNVVESEIDDSPLCDRTLEIVRNEVPVKNENNQIIESMKLEPVDDKTIDAIDTVNTSKISSDNDEKISSEDDVKRIDTFDPCYEHSEIKFTSKRTEESLRDEIMACYESESKKPETTPRQATSLERLLGIFQHPGSLFSTGSYVDRTEIKNPLQDGVNSMLALGDKFHQYLRDGRVSNNTTKCTTTSSDGSTSHPILQRSSSDATKSCVKVDPVKSLSIPQLSSIQATCIGVTVMDDKILRFVEESRNETTTKLESFDNVDKALIEDCQGGTNEKTSGTREDSILMENSQIKEKINEDFRDDREKNGKLNENNERRDDDSCDNDDDTLCHDNGCKITSVCTRLKDIPEYSILEMRTSDENEASNEKVDSSSNDKVNSSCNDNVDSSSNDNVDSSCNEKINDDIIKKEAITYAIIKCDRSSSRTTDSINDHSCKNTSHFNVKCDMSGAINVHTLRDESSSKQGDVHNFFTTRLNEETKITMKKYDDDDDAAMISDSERICKDENSRITKIEENQAEEKNCTNVDENFGQDAVTLNRDNDNFNDKNLDIAMEDSSLSEFVDSKNFHEISPVTRPKINFLATSDQTSTIEEFFPIETKNVRQDESKISNETINPRVNNYCQALECETSPEKICNEDFRTNDKIEEMTKFNEFPTIEKSSETLYVRVPNTAVLKNEFSITRIAIATIDDDDYVTATKEQVSSSLSEDSGYSGKIMIDDARNCEITLNYKDEQRLEEDSIIRGIERLDNMDETEALLFQQQEQQQDLAFSDNTETNLDSFVSLENVEPRIDTNDIESSESSEDLIFKITDIDATIVSKDNAKSYVTEIRVSEQDSTIYPQCYYEIGQSSSSSIVGGGNLFIEKSQNIHRNSQDSGIEETTASIIDEYRTDTSQNQTSEMFQESLDSGIDSECSSVCVRLDIGADAQKERARDPGKLEIVVVRRSINDDDDDDVDDDEIARYATSSSIVIDEILGTKDIRIYDDTTRITRILDDDDDEQRNVAMKISNVIGTMDEAT